MIGYLIYKNGGGSVGAVMIVPFLLVLLAAGWVVYDKLAPETVSQLIAGIEEAVNPVWPGWPVTLALLAAILPGCHVRRAPRLSSLPPGPPRASTGVT